MRRGFTLIELIVVMGIFAALTGIATINLSNARSKTSLTSATEVFVADLKSQQVRSMAGEEDSGSSASAHGIHFEENSYTLFKGSSYSPSGSRNFRINLPQGTEFSPVNSDVVFEVGSGEIAGDTVVTIRRVSDGNQKEVIINRYGVVEEIN
jgi:prepilin-type N-terminal cleavage/methylation domain-containing protein